MWQKIVLKLEQGKKYIVELIDQSTVSMSLSTAHFLIDLLYGTTDKGAIYLLSESN